MRRLSIVFALLLSGCANVGIEAADLAAPIETASLPPPAERPPRELPKALQRAVEDTRKPLNAFLSDKGSNCGSSKLKEATSRATDMASAMATALRPDYEATLAAGAVVLDVADGARSKGCSREAKALYDFVLKNYGGLGYAALRDRAAAGIRDLHGKV
jgi:hypothetical protein